MEYIIQSYVDLITNSSTSVFTWATSPEAVKEIINAVLKSSNIHNAAILNKINGLFDYDASYC